MAETLTLDMLESVNRTADEKNYGLVVDYYDVFDHLKDALVIFNAEDIKTAVTSLRDEKLTLESNYRQVMQLFQRVDLNNLGQYILTLKMKMID